MPTLRAQVLYVQSLVSSLVFVLLLLPFCSSSRDNITFGNPISDLANETLVSANRRFELGFFTPNGRSSAGRYVGIWYYGDQPRTVVWVANRDKPLVNNNGLFGLAGDGNLAVWTSSQRMLLSSVPKSKSSSSRTIRLLDTGNLVLRDGKSQDLWQSFEHPADTFIPGMLWGENFNLTSWNALDDPKPGNFTFQVDPHRNNEYMIQNQDTTYWKSEVYGKLQQPDGMITMISCLLSKSSCGLSNSSKISPIKNISYTMNVSNFDFNLTRLVMDYTGQIRFYLRDKASTLWTLDRYQPRDVCSIFQYCGKYGSCNTENIVHCKCLPGFEPAEPKKWSSMEYSNGCKRISNSSLCATNDFIIFEKMKASSPDEIEVESEEDCKKSCLNNCACEAYYCASASRETGGSSKTCWTWSRGLNNILEQTEDPYNLNVRMASADIDPGKRSCKYCGTNLVPYPLSFEKSCGDGSYFNFSCDSRISQLYFNTSSTSYRVANVFPKDEKFAISLDGNITNCTTYIDLPNNTLQLDLPPHYHIINGCNSSKNYTPSIFPQNQVLYEVEIRWSTPPAPNCTSDSDCVDWSGTACNETSDGRKICQCHANNSWYPSIPCAPAMASTQPGRLSLDKKLFYLIAPVTIVILILLVGLLYYRRKGQKNENGEAIQGNQAFRLYDTEQRIKEWISSNQFQEEDKKGMDVPFFDLKIILAATDCFSIDNKLGQGGFGPVYKGTFPGGQEIAIKRLSSASGQGLDEFKNEVVLIAKLQHRNLVRLLGYCIEGEEKMLLYEYMPNGSLDSFIFDRTRCLLLTWDLRFEIIQGIARGMLYLHQDSRLRIIHRDLKSSNVLLDEEMNPKISDFGLARIFESKQTEASTKRVMGTYGYMSPEYALDGFFSVKSDVFSFGVVVLEIISGKRNTAFYQSIGTLNLVSHAWKFWSENNALNLMDNSLRETYNTSEVLKCINVALLCVQEEPTDRPTMSNVLFMLGSESASLPAPKKPGFAVNRSFSTTSSSSRPETIYEMSTTVVEGR